VLSTDSNLQRRRANAPGSADKAEPDQSTSALPLPHPNLDGTLEELPNEASSSQNVAASHPGVALPSRPQSLPIQSQVSAEWFFKILHCIFCGITERLSSALCRYLLVDLYIRSSTFQQLHLLQTSWIFQKGLKKNQFCRPRLEAELWTCYHC
jgi:hypothetical protein